MPQSIAPAFVKVEYTSAAGPHIMELPTRAWTEGGGGFASGSFPRWSDDAAREADSMINDLLDTFLPIFSTTTTFSRYTIFTQSSPTARPQPRFSATINLVGTDVSGSWEKAVQATMSFRTEDFNASKLTFLDLPSHDLFAKSTVIDPMGDYAPIFVEWTGSSNAWSGRDGARPSTFVSLTWDLNDKLRRTYRLA